jgi:hypothetical protein
MYPTLRGTIKNIAPGFICSCLLTFKPRHPSIFPLAVFGATYRNFFITVQLAGTVISIVAF